MCVGGIILNWMLKMEWEGVHWAQDSGYWTLRFYKMWETFD
jgi:hypothetical protein